MKFTLPLAAAAASLVLVASATAAQDADDRKAETSEGASAPIVIPPITAPDSDERAEEEAKEEKRICRRIRLDMSSRRAERVCKTREEWREFNGVD